MTALLQARHLRHQFGSFVALDDVTLSIEAGARHALIGPNGAGKTTLINVLTGWLVPQSGSVELRGEDITHLPQHQRVKRGLARTFQINRLFSELTVLESVTLATCERLGGGGHWFKAVASHGQAVDEAAAVLTQLGLLAQAHQATHRLAYGKQRLLEIALALAVQPRVLLLDEPAAGVPTHESRELFDTLAQLPSDVAIVLVEHDMDLVFRFASRISVLANGRVLAEGTPSEIAAHRDVRDVYLGNLGSPSHG